MTRSFITACLVATALSTAPALAQNNHADSNTQDFVRNAAIGGMFEIQSSQLALNKSQDRDVRDFAQKMITDHRQADEKLKSLAKNETIPTSLDSAHEQMLQHLRGENGSNFVEAFKQDQVTAHREAVNLFQNYANNGSDPQLKQFAQQTLPTLQNHLQMAQGITIANNGNNRGNTQSAGNLQYLTNETAGTWRASKVVGLGVYNEQNQKVGNIDDVLFDRNGRVEGVVIGVGGFLGLGQRNVAVPYNDLRWSMTPPNSNTAANGNGSGANTNTPQNANGNPNATATTTGAVGGLGTAGDMGGPPATTNNNTNLASNTNASNNNGGAAYPDHAILPNASRDQLNNAPQFNYAQAPR
jgi:putative membrane protein